MHTTLDNPMWGMQFLQTKIRIQCGVFKHLCRGARPKEYRLYDHLCTGWGVEFDMEI